MSRLRDSVGRLIRLSDAIVEEEYGNGGVMTCSVGHRVIFTAEQAGEYLRRNCWPNGCRYQWCRAAIVELESWPG